VAQRQAAEWLGEKNAADTLHAVRPHNVTSEMGLALLDVADVIRRGRRWWRSGQASRTRASGRAGEAPGVTEARDAIAAYLDRYGMRLRRRDRHHQPRWRERPTTLRAP